MKKSLPARPNLEHLRTQAKNSSRAPRRRCRAARTFIDHLPAARRMTPARCGAPDSASPTPNRRSRASRASRHGRVSPAMSSSCARLKANGSSCRSRSTAARCPAPMTAHSRMLIDGDRFRMESPEATLRGHLHARRRSRSAGSTSSSSKARKRATGPTASTVSTATTCSCVSASPERRARHVRDDRRIRSRARAVATIVAGAAGERHWRTRAATARASPPAGDGVRDRRRSGVRTDHDPAAEAAARRMGAGQADHGRTAARRGVPVVRLADDDGQRDEGDLRRTGHGAREGPDRRIHNAGRGRLPEHRPRREGRDARIMDLEGDVVRFCMAPAGGSRPAEFSSEKGSGRILSEWKRK